MGNCCSDQQAITTDSMSLNHMKGQNSDEFFSNADFIAQLQAHRKRIDNPMSEIEELESIPPEKLRFKREIEKEHGELKLPQKYMNPNLPFIGPIRLKDGGIYQGQFHNEMKFGVGEIFYNDNSYYYGTFRDDVKNGVGRLVHAKGDFFEGDWENDIANGYGRYKGDEAEYQGSWKENQQHGHGKEKWINGDVYEGNYVEGAKHGTGIFKFDNGDEYEGEFNEDQISGYGVYKFKNGKIYKGDWVNCKMDGTAAVSYTHLTLPTTPYV